MTISYPPMNKRFEYFKDWVCWATGATVVWRDQADGGRVREANEVWIDLRPLRISKLGVDEHRQIDVDNEAGDAEYPRQEVTVSLCNIEFEIRGMSRSQEHENTGWAALLDAHLKVYNRYGHEKFFKPACFSVNEVSDIINMPQFPTHDMRVEDIALFNINFNTVLTDSDAYAVGTWIESVEITSDIKDAGGVSLPASLQLSNEVIT